MTSMYINRAKIQIKTTLLSEVTGTRYIYLRVNVELIIKAYEAKYLCFIGCAKE